ncbi:MAG TPA: AAA family ATPase [Nannocystis sp.]|jgi:predicted ATPase
MTGTKAITRIQVEGFCSLKSVDLVPGRITVLIGPNGAGKSNLLDLLRMIPLMRTQSLRRFVGEAGGASALLHYGPKTTRVMSIRLEFQQDTGTNAYAANLGYASGDSLIFLDESIEHKSRAAPAAGRVATLGAGHAESRLEEEAQNGDNTAKTVRWWLSKINFYHFHDTSLTSPLRQNARQADDKYLRSDGSNLAAFLRRLANSEAAEDIASWKRIGMLIQKIAPYIKRLEPDLVDPANPVTSTVHLRWVDDRDYTFGVHDLSDGTLRAIALITALSQPVSRLPAFVTIDEPELGLHPAAITLLAGLVRSIAPHCQVLLATQSPALLDEFSADEVVVAERQNGETVFQHLDAEKLKNWLEEYSLSELFDKNVLGGRP